MRLMDRTPSSRHNIELANILRQTKSTKLESYETERLTKAGATFKIQMVAIPLRNESGKLYAVAVLERAYQS